MKTTVIPALIILALVAACSGKDPCEPVSPTLSAQQLGLILEGALVCSDEEMILTLDYPELDTADSLRLVYRRSLEDHGWTVTQGQAPSTMTGVRGQETIVLVATDNRERGVPTMIIRY